MLDGQGHEVVETKFVAQRLGCLLELLAGQLKLRGYDEMAKRIEAVEPLRIFNRVMQAGDSPANERDFLVLVALGQVPGKVERAR